MVNETNRPAALPVCVILILSMFLAAPALAAKAGKPKKASKPVAGDVAVDALEALPGFKIELVLQADSAKNGSFISMTKDERGRLLLGGQKGEPITRLTLKDGKVAEQEALKIPLSEVMGMLFAFDSLYIDGGGKDKAGKPIYGLYRCRDPKGDGSYDQIEMLREWQHGTGDHGAHAILLGPDKKKLYIVVGNFVDTPGDLLPTSPHRNYADDHALPRAEDGNGFGAGKKPPGGSVIRMDPDGKNAELFAAGERNTYDVAFNADGELFGFDSDMEWDWGMPWYRPIRVYHAPSGADQGFREGSGKWPEYYPDSLPAAVNIGLGCPTGVSFGYGAKFPAKYQKALFVLDWTYGRIMAVHLTPKGSTYTGAWENFVWPKSLHSDGNKTPNNCTDVVIGDDGALYYSCGGRNTQGYLYRVTYEGDEPIAAADYHDTAGAEARDTRHKLEAFHGHADEAAVALAWTNLNSEDRFVRYAARIAIESQPVAKWKSQALEESKPEAALSGLLALARVGGKEAQPELLKALARLSLSSLSESQQIEKLRVLEVSISRQGKPQGEQAKQVVEELDPLYPATSDALNRELCQVLLALDAPNAVEKSMKLFEQAKTQEQQVQYILYLRTIKTGWTDALRKSYFSWWTQDHAKAVHPESVDKWFAEAGRPYGDGSSYQRYLGNLRDDAIKTLTPEEKTSLKSLLDAYTPPGPKVSKKAAKVRLVVKAWTMADVQPLLDQVGKGRNYEQGKEAFNAAQCLACHRFGTEGGPTGPDLTAIASRFSRRDILESILEPSKIISEQYMNTEVRTKDGDVVSGRVVEDTADSIILQPSPLATDRVTVKKADVKSRGPSKLSPMPEGLVNILKQDELLDMLAYLESGGKKEHPDFAK